MLISFLVIIVGVLFVFWFRFSGGQARLMTENDIADLIKIQVNYAISSWWNIAFAWLWLMLIYFVIVSRWLKKKLGKIMRAVLAWALFLLGLYFSFTRGGMFYGLLACLFCIIFAAALVGLNFLRLFLKELFSMSR